jgi:hypothetical protein
LIVFVIDDGKTEETRPHPTGDPTMPDNMTDLEAVHLPPALTAADFRAGTAMECSPRFVAVHVEAKQLGAVYDRHHRNWTTFWPITENDFASGVVPMLAADDAAGMTADAAIAKARAN